MENVLTIDSKSLTLNDLQREVYHTAKSSGEDGINEWSSDHYYELSKSTISDPRYDLVKATGTSPSYLITRKNSILVSTTMRTVLPAIRVKNDYVNDVEVCWTKKIGNAMTLKGSLIIGDTDASSFTREWLDVYDQYFVPKSEAHDKEMKKGNHPSLIEWRTYLPPLPIEVDQPFMYSHHPSMNLHMYMIPSGTTVTQSYELELSIDKLLRMRKKDNQGIWVNCSTIDLNLLDIKSDTRTIPTPTLYCRFRNNTDQEKAYTRCPGTYKVYYYDVISGNSEHDIALGSPIVHDIKHGVPCIGFIHHAKNKEAISYNSHSNYTTDSIDQSTGISPCSTISVTYGSSDYRLVDYPIDLLNTFNSSVFPSIPHDEGYSAYSIGSIVNLHRISDTIIPGNIGMKIVLNTSSYNPFDENEVFPPNNNGSLRSSTSFRCYIHAITLRSITFIFNNSNAPTDVVIV